MSENLLCFLGNGLVCQSELKASDQHLIEGEVRRAHSHLLLQAIFFHPSQIYSMHVEELDQ